MVDKLRFSKGLEFNDVALIDFFSYIVTIGNGREWENLLRWIWSTTGYTTTESSEEVRGRQLESCDYSLSHPQFLDQAMLLYTALARARNHLYLIEINEFGAQNALGRSRGRTTSTACIGLDDFAFLRLKDLDLLKIIKSIHEGFVEMTPAPNTRHEVCFW